MILTQQIPVVIWHGSMIGTEIKIRVIVVVVVVVVVTVNVTVVSIRSSVECDSEEQQK